MLLVFSFNSEPFPSPWTKFTFKWYHELINSFYLWKAFSTSLIIAFCSTAISVLMGIFLIFYAAQGGRIGKFFSLFYGNMLIPETVLAVSLLSFFSWMGIPLGLITLIVAHTVLGLGFVIPMVYSRFLELDTRLTEASLVLGATPLQTFFKVTLPLLAPSLITSALLVFIISFDDFILSYFCAGSTTQTLSLYILSMIRTGVTPLVNALSTILLALSSVLVLFFFFNLKRARGFLVKSFFIRFSIMVFWSAIILALLYLPGMQIFPSKEKSINVFTWGDILERSVIDEFERSTGIKVHLSYYASNEELLVKLKATGGKGYDLIIPSDYSVKILKEEGLLKKTRPQ